MKTELKEGARYIYVNTDTTGLFIFLRYTEQNDLLFFLVRRDGVSRTITVSRETFLNEIKPYLTEVTSSDTGIDDILNDLQEHNSCIHS